MWIEISHILSCQTIYFLFRDVISKPFYKDLLSQKTVKSYVQKRWCKSCECDLNWCLTYKRIIAKYRLSYYDRV